MNNLEKIKYTAKWLFDAVRIEPNKEIPFICCHPFTETTVTMSINGNMIDLTKLEDYTAWRNQIFKLIDELDTPSKICFFIQKAWRLTFLKYAKEYMDKKTFDELFAEVWIVTENPNMDANVNLRTLVSWFKSADKKVLMEEEEYAYWEKLPENITVYRGVSRGRKREGLSWTINRKEAEWFASRFGEGYVLKAVIPKENTLCYFNRRNEDEIVVDVFRIKNLIEEL